MVAVVIENIGNGCALLHHIMAAGQILDKTCRIIPPSDVGIEMCTCEIFLPRQAHFFGRSGESMEINEVQTCTKFMVNAGFHICPNHIVPMRSDGRERLCTHQFFIENFSGTGGLFHKKAVNMLAAVGRRRPKFGHHNLRMGIVFQTIKRSCMRTCGFGLQPNAIFFRPFSENMVVVV